MIPSLVRTTIKTWHSRDGLKAAEINGGFCEDFAEEVVRLLVEQGELRALVIHDGWFTQEGQDEEFWRHAWVYLDGFHYDSESPQGVEDWIQLKFFRRCEKAEPGKIERLQSRNDERKRLDASSKLSVKVRREIAGLKEIA